MKKPIEELLKMTAYELECYHNTIPKEERQHKAVVLGVWKYKTKFKQTSLFDNHLMPC